MILAAVTKVSYKHGLWLVARINYCKYIIFAERLPLPSLTVQNANPSLSLPLLFSFVLIYALIKKAPIYDLFIEGAKEGLQTAVEILPFILAIFIGIEGLVSSGAMEWLEHLLAPLFLRLGIPEELISLVLLRPVSGSGSLVLVEEILESAGADSFAGRAASVMAGSCETVFYVLAVYFGAVRINKVGAALPCALLADFAGIIAAVAVSYLFSTQTNCRKYKRCKQSYTSR